MFYSIIALRSLWGNNSLTGFPAATLSIIHAENQDTNTVVDTVKLSYIWPRLRASGDNTLLSRFHICQVGFEAGRGPWIRFHCTIRHVSGQTTIQKIKPPQKTNKSRNGWLRGD